MKRSHVLLSPAAVLLPVLTCQAAEAQGFDVVLTGEPVIAVWLAQRLLTDLKARGNGS